MCVFVHVCVCVCVCVCVVGGWVDGCGGVQEGKERKSREENK